MSELRERERSQAATVVISELRWKLNQWQPVKGAEDADWWANELDCVLSTLRHAVDNDWEDAVACRGSDESCDAAWPSIEIERSDSRWSAGRWCRIVLGVLRNRPEEFEDPYNAVLGVGLWIVGKCAEPTEQDWARWTEANAAAVTAIHDMLTNQPDDAAIATVAENPLRYVNTPADSNILQALAESKTTQHQVDIENSSGERARMVKDRLPVLEKAGLVERLHGVRKGYSITPDGRKLISLNSDR